MNSHAEMPTELRPVQYLGYAAGEVANNLTFQMVSVFLLIYYTMSRASPQQLRARSSSLSGSGVASQTCLPVAALTKPRRDGASSGLTSFSARYRCSCYWWRCSPSRKGSATAARWPGHLPPMLSFRSPTASSTSLTGRWRRRSPRSRTPVQSFRPRARFLPVSPSS